MYYTQKSRSNVIVSTFHHGRVAWLEQPETKERVEMFWDIYQKKFVNAQEFCRLKKERAQINREKHALVPFGARTRALRRREQGFSSTLDGLITA